MELKKFILFVGPILLLEILAAIAGIYYLKKTAFPVKNSKLLVFFISLTIAFEFIGSYAVIAFFSDYKYFSFIKGTVFANNYWWYNIFAVLNFSFFTYYFVSFLRNRTTKTIFHILIMVFIIMSSIYYMIVPNFFMHSPTLVGVSGTLLLLFSIMTFYFELLRSDMLLKIKQFLPFYISIGVLVFNLTVTPIEMLSKYFTGEDGNELFVSFHLKTFLFANIFLYLTFIIGFIVCSKKKFLY